ncbi:Trk system potassium transporter TrkA [Natronospirillum operosum]|uniref:Trk system potassium uptake protein TrkA n=1 Tax=Natronospirillum operosum TaxID=2759953 RepID=A0A4Z0WAD9_9GAMM|nr:Trk system potassium transporter TrkA [Natronospirillum operosum]TGG91497.1 Trk system potassium transporter TrkA [Natronospirillum operosum]
MKIVILGAGQVGGSLADTLAHEDNDITLVDTDLERLRDLQERLDIRTVHGMASHPTVMSQAGADEADLIICVTSSDEVNMAASQVALALFKTPTKIARIRNPDYLKHADALFRTEACPVDVLISPEQVVCDYIRRLIEHPGALQVLDFAEGHIKLVGVRAYEGGPLVGQELRFLKQHMPNVPARVAAIFRKDRPILPEGNTRIEPGDEVFFIAASANIRAVMSELRRKEVAYKRILIAGGGNIGFRLASSIEHRYRVKLLERNPERCHHLSEHLNNTVVLQGNASDQELLISENIEDTDIFISLTNDDEANIMSSMLAKRLGARKVMALINNPAYVDLVQGGEIDIAISPSLATIGSLLTHVRRGDIVNVHSLRRGAAEAVEAVAHGDRNSSRVVGRNIADIDLPEGTTIGAVVREGEVIMAHRGLVIEAEDHVILFLMNKKRIRDVERLFQVGLTFF